MKKVMIAVMLILPSLSFATNVAEVMGEASAAVTLSPSIIVAPVTATTAFTVEHKVILAAGEDAAAFIATEGAIETARLQEAFDIIRKSNPAIEASNLDLAQLILAYQ